MITGVFVEVAKVRVLGQPFKHLVNEGKREVIFPGSVGYHNQGHPNLGTKTPSKVQNMIR